MIGSLPSKAEVKRAVPVHYLYPPARVWLEEDQLCSTRAFKFRRRGDRLLRESRQPGREMLHQFVKLADAKNEAILRFAQHWGVLGICEHGLPAVHSRKREPNPTWFGWDRPVWSIGECIPVRKGGNAWVEPLLTWRRLSERFGALERIARKLSAEGLGRLEDWKKVYGPWPIEGREYSGRDVDEYGLEMKIPSWRREIRQERHLVAVAVNHLLAVGGTAPFLQWDAKGPPHFRLGSDGLFSALAVQLMLSVARADSLVECSGCDAAYIPTRKPRAREHHFCPDCRRGKVAQRLGQERHRLREKARRLRQDGQSATNIAQALEADVTTVKGWLAPKKRRRGKRP